MVESYDIFLSSPMSALTGKNEYEEERNRMLDLIEIFTNDWGAKNVYYAGQNFPSIASFDSEIISFQHCMSAVEKSDLFIMIYPKGVVSSVLVEVGYALALKKKCAFFTKRIKTLPYVLRNPVGLTPTPKIYTYKSFDSLKKFMLKSKQEICTFNNQLSFFDISMLDDDPEASQ